MRQPGSRRRERRIGPRGVRIRLLFLLASCFSACEHDARAQACCTGASGLVPGWLTNHERFLIGTQLRLAQTHGTYPTSGSFYAPPPGRDARMEASLFGSVRCVPRGQVSVLAPFMMVRRRAGGLVEERVTPGDVAVVSRYELARIGERVHVPGVALLGGIQLPTGTPPNETTGLLAADATGIGAFEASAGVSIEQTFGHLVLHTTVLGGYRFARPVLGVEERLGLRGLYVLGAGWTFDREIAILGAISHVSEGDATVAGALAVGTGARTTQLALLVVVPITDALRLRASAFTDVPPLGLNRPALGGTTISLARSWL